MKITRSEIFSIKMILNYLLLYRISLCFLVEFVIQNITKRGDVPLYLNANPIEVFKLKGFEAFTHGTPLAQLIIGTVSSIVRIELITHIIFTLLAYYGIKTFLESIPDKNNRYYKILLLLCFLPAFNLWSSIAGKETIIVFSMGIVSSQIIRFFSGQKIKTGFLFFLSLYLIFIIKQQYIPAVLQLFLYMMLRQKIKLTWKKDLAFFMMLVAVNLLVIYLMRYRIDNYAFNVYRYFRFEGGSTRDRFFIEQFDFFRKIPYLMPIAMWGPTITEAKKSILHMFAFADSLALFSLILFIIKDFIKRIFTDFKLYYQWFFLSVISIWWLFMAQYMQGIMNPGAAIRYRTNLFLLLVALIYSLTLVKKENSHN